MQAGSTREGWRRLGVLSALLLLSQGLSCSAGSDGGLALRQSRNESAFFSAVADARVHELRQRFQLARSSVIADGIGARFELLGDGMHVRAVIPRDAKRGVLRTASVDLPVSASNVARVADDASRVRIAFALRGASRGARVTTTSDGVVVYKGAFRGSDVVHRVTAEGTEDYVVFETRPAREEITYDVDVSGAAGLRLVENTLEFLDRGGVPGLRVAPPHVVDARGVVHDATLAIDGCAYDADPRGPWGRDVIRPGAQTCSVRIVWTSDTYPAVVDPAWVATGSMAAKRVDHTATLLGSGRVLVTGGQGGGYLSSAELFDPSGSGSFAATGSLKTVRAYHTATLLGSGKVLVTGGWNGSSPLSTAELYDPTGSGSFAATSPMAAARRGHTATLLGSGKVLVAGGLASTSVYLSTAELFDPNGSGSFSATGSLKSTRAWHTATLLGSGKVLIAGGGNSSLLANAELFDPTGSGSFVATSPLATARVYHTATLLGSGKVLVAGGQSVYEILSSAELFDPSGSGSFAATGSLATARMDHSATLLGSGKVLVAGGYNLGAGFLSSAELFDPSGSGSFAATGSTVTARSGHRDALLGSGKVLIAGGQTTGDILSSAELFQLIVTGGTCTVGGECVTGYCADGFCCDKSCTGCYACSAAKTGGANGTCGPVPAGTDPNDGCPQEAPNTCQRTGSCNGVGGCQLYPSGTPCGSSGCSNGIVSTSQCDGNGTCAAKQTSCAPYANCADAIACATSCASDSDCAASAYCDSASSTCQLDFAQGAPCTSDAQCPNNHCVDQVCCETACAEPCFACSVAAKGSGMNGQCGAVAAGSDPHDSCSDEGSASCGKTGACNGNGACALYSKGTVCGVPGQCNGTVLSGGDACDGLGKCQLNANSIDCAPFACVEGSGCKSACATNADCAPTAWCAGGVCQTKMVQGAPCTSAGECATGFCVDGMCCSAACTGQCEACDVGGGGLCVPVSGTPHGSRPVCPTPDGGSVCETLTCDGIDTTACQCIGAAKCDGDHTITGPDGVTQIDCSPYECDPSGACNTSCASGSDCIGGYVCDAAGRCVPRPSAPPADDSGCGCRQAGRERGAPPLPAWVIAIAVALVARLRRRNSRGPVGGLWPTKDLDPCANGVAAALGPHASGHSRIQSRNIRYSITWSWRVEASELGSPKSNCRSPSITARIRSSLSIACSGRKTSGSRADPGRWPL